MHRKVIIIIYLCLSFLLIPWKTAFPYLWVNGEKYIFSDSVLENGRLLIRSFQRMQNVLRNCYTKLTQESMGLALEAIKQEVVMVLEENDGDWTHFERIYVNELMIIEKKARRLVSDAIILDKELQSIEIREKMRGKILLSNLDAYNSCRRKLSALVSEINSVANTEGTGRDDLDLSILLEAEGVIRRVSREQSRAVRLLAEQIRNSFMNIRLLLRKYDENIEMVDPQLKNNADLLGVLQEYEKSWEKGKHYLLEARKCGFLLSFSHMLESTGEKYREFQEKLECRDADIFVIIPCLLILKFLDNEDRSVCLYFFPQMAKAGEKAHQVHGELAEEFKKWKALNLKNYQYFNIVEKALIGITLTEEEKENVEKATMKGFEGILKKIKVLAIELERNKPAEWNEFLDAALMN